MRASVLTPYVEAIPGEVAEVQFEIVNTLEIVDLVTISAIGLQPGEVDFDRDSVSLFPDETAVVTMRIRLRASYPAGLGTIDVRIASTLRPDVTELRSVEVDVAEVAGADLRVLPQAVVCNSRARIEALIGNTGNTDLNFSVLARDNELHLRFVVDPPTLRIRPGTRAAVVIEAKGRRPWFGAREYRSVFVNAESEAGLLQDTISVAQRPVLARGVFTAALLAIIVALWATIMTQGVNFALNSGTAAKNVPSDFARPLSYATLAKVGSAGAGGGAGADAVARIVGSMGGRVVGEDSGQPLSRVTVEAHRKNPREPDAVLGSEQTLVRSAATDEAGTFTLQGVFPGEYFLRISGTNFTSIWFESSADPDNTENGMTKVTLGPGGEVTLPAIPLAGVPGTITGTVDTGDQTDPVTIVVRPVVNDVVGVEVARIDITPVDEDGDGFADGSVDYELPGLATPLDYSITFNSTRFADQTITESIGPGASLVATPVRLLPGDGQATGSILLRGPAPTGPVSVTATMGELTFVTESPTPTPDDSRNGTTTTFRFTGLPTPGTYSLTVNAPGFEQNQTSIDLVPGAERAVGEIELVAGTRTLLGTVVDAVSGVRLGGVDVTVLGPNGTVATRTLPAPTKPGTTPSSDCRTPEPTPTYDAASGAGTFLLDNLPLGISAVTLSKTGYTSLTFRLDVRGDSAPVVLTKGVGPSSFSLSNRVGEVCGVVRDSKGVGIPAGKVVVRGGPGDPRDPTPLATDPSGNYRLGELQSGEYTLTASGDGHRDCSVLFTIEPGPRDKRRLVIDLALVVTGSPRDQPCTASVKPT